MKLFQLCVMVTLIGFGAACSKKTNRQAKEFLDKQSNDIADITETTTEKGSPEIEAPFKIQAFAVINAENEELANLSLYQLLLSAEINGGLGEEERNLIISKVEGNSEDLAENLSLVQSKTNISNSDLCIEVGKNISKFKLDDKSLIHISGSDLSNEVERSLETDCNALVIKNSDITVAALKNLCALGAPRKIEVAPIEKLEIKPLAAPLEIDPTIQVDPSLEINAEEIDNTEE